MAVSHAGNQVRRQRHTFSHHIGHCPCRLPVPADRRAMSVSRPKALIAAILTRRYTDNPRNNPDAKPVRVVRDIQKVRQQGAQIVLNQIHQVLTPSLNVHSGDITRHRRNVDEIDRGGASHCGWHNDYRHAFRARRGCVWGHPGRSGAIGRWSADAES